MTDSILWGESRRKKSRAECWFGNVLMSENSKDIPEGVIMVTAGGLKGYSAGNFNVPDVSVR